jgi:hypothetical protein
VPDVALLSRTLYCIPNMTTYIPTLQLHPFHFARYQFYPLFLKLVHFLSLNDSWFALPMASLFQSILLSLSFLFMLSNHRCVLNTRTSTFVLSIYPFNFLLLRNLPLPQSLSLTFVCFAFGFFQSERIFIASIFCLLATLTSIEGVFCPLALSIVLLWDRRFRDLLCVLLISSAAIPLCARLSLYMYSNPWAFVTIWADEIRIPYSSFGELASERPIAFWFGTVLSYLVPSIVGTVLLLPISKPHFVYCLISLACVAFIDGKKVEKYGCGCAAFAVIIGFDENIGLLSRRLRNPIILVIVETLAVSGAIQSLESHVTFAQYCEFALGIRRDMVNTVLRHPVVSGP